MDYFSIQSKRRKLKARVTDDLIYNCDLQIYKEPPSGKISLMEFQELGLERLKGIIFIILKIHR